MGYGWDGEARNEAFSFDHMPSPSEIIAREALFLSLAGKCAMADDPKATRSWEEIVSDASRERDTEKLRMLAEELERALDERDKRIRPEPSRGDRKPPRKSA